MGDNVNLAARLEGANKFYKTYAMIAENTYKLAEDSIDVRYLDVVEWFEITGFWPKRINWQVPCRKFWNTMKRYELLQESKLWDAIMNFENA